MGNLYPILIAAWRKFGEDSERTEILQLFELAQYERKLRTDAGEPLSLTLPEILSSEYQTEHSCRSTRRGAWMRRGRLRTRRSSIAWAT